MTLLGLTAPLWWWALALLATVCFAIVIAEYAIRPQAPRT